MQKKVIIANWKMNPNTLREARAIFLGIRKKVAKLKKTRVIICPPAVYIGELKRMQKGTKILIGTQDCFNQCKGAWTGALSPKMLKSVGAEFVIVGHSEKRARGESDEIINQKMKLALKSGLKTILCVGEKKRDEEGDYFGFLEKQLLSALNGIGKNFSKKILIAYEPIWAVGKKAKRVITNKELRQVCIFIKKVLADKYGSKNFGAVEILYGGSVDYKNAEGLMLESGIDGFLVGRESLNIEKFGNLLEVVEKN
ncbi:MAG: triose-phosphate isomerase [Candidatus Pacebacteria bacterium]|nr:triose-phosphate isomerase [Candidatus Paceibacterota bacterium]